MAMQYTAETVSEELTALSTAGDFYEPAEITAKAADLIGKYVSHLQRRVLFVKNLITEVRFRVLAERCPADGGAQGGLVKGWNSTGLVTDDKISEVLTLMKSRVYSDTPPSQPPPSETSGSKNSQKVGVPIFHPNGKPSDWMVVRACLLHNTADC